MLCYDDCGRGPPYAKVILGTWRSSQDLELLSKEKEVAAETAAGSGSCWERGESRAGQLGACMGEAGQTSSEEELMDPTGPEAGASTLSLLLKPGGQGQGAWVEMLSELMAVSEDTKDETMEGGDE
eukprot:939842-Pelagomonas_calceolata.AAC.2